MRFFFSTLILLSICSLSAAQVFEPTPELIEANKRFEKAKEHFLNKDFAYVLNYYDSILSDSKYTRLITYKMASESSINLASINSNDSILYMNMSDEIYFEAVKWYGKMHINEQWDSMKIGLNKEPEVFTIVDSPAEFPGGMAAFYKYVSHELNYPEEARRMGIEGRVYVQFVVNKDGSVDAVNAVQEIGGGCDEEAIRVMKNAPNFIPGTQRGNPVYVRMVMPIIFKLSDNPANKKRKKRR